MLPVVYDVPGAEREQPVRLCVGARYRDDVGARCDCDLGHVSTSKRFPSAETIPATYLQCRHADAPRSLDQNPVALLDRPSRHAHQRVPGRKPRARQGGGLLVGHVPGHGDKGAVVQDDLSAQRPVHLLAQAGADVFKARQGVVLDVGDHVGHDLRAGLEPSQGIRHSRADRKHHARAVGARDDIRSRGERNGTGWVALLSCQWEMGSCVIDRYQPTRQIASSL